MSGFITISTASDGLKTEHIHHRDCHFVAVTSGSLLLHILATKEQAEIISAAINNAFGNRISGSRPLVSTDHEVAA